MPLGLEVNPNCLRSTKQEYVGSSVTLSQKNCYGSKRGKETKRPLRFSSALCDMFLNRSSLFETKSCANVESNIMLFQYNATYRTICFAHNFCFREVFCNKNLFSSSRGDLIDHLGSCGNDTSFFFKNCGKDFGFCHSATFLRKKNNL